MLEKKLISNVHDLRIWKNDICKEDISNNTPTQYPCIVVWKQNEYGNGFLFTEYFFIYQEEFHKQMEIDPIADKNCRERYGDCHLRMEKK